MAPARPFVLLGLVGSASLAAGCGSAAEPGTVGPAAAGATRSLGAGAASTPSPARRARGPGCEPLPPLPPAAVTARPATLASSGIYACALTPSARVACWGRLPGTPPTSTASTPTPTLVEDVSHAIGVAAGPTRACALIAGGPVRCWGWNGQARDYGPDQAEPRGTRAPVAGAMAIAVGAHHVCAVQQLGGYVRCWGANDGGQLGEGDRVDRTEAVNVPGLASVVRLVADGDSTCALKSNGTVWCWGRNDAGRLGLDPEEQGPGIAFQRLDATNGVNVPPESHNIYSIQERLMPTPVPCLSGAIDVALGTMLGCALRSDQSMVCWGAHESHPPWAPRAAAEGDPFTAFTPSALAGRRHVVAGARGRAIGMSGDLSCIAADDGAVRCFEMNVPKADDDPARRLHPIGAFSDAVEVSPPCARLASGEAWCWGRNDYGELGDGTTDPSRRSHPPTRVLLPP